jgi:hypothetical protein
MVLVRARRQIPAQAHGDRSGCNLRQPGNDYNAGRRDCHRPGKSRGQGERNRQAVRHPDHHVPDCLRGLEVFFSVRCAGHKSNIRPVGQIVNLRRGQEA